MSKVKIISDRNKKSLKIKSTLMNSLKKFDYNKDICVVIGAGSTLTKNVKDNSLSLTRANQIEIRKYRKK